MNIIYMLNFHTFTHFCSTTGSKREHGLRGREGWLEEIRDGEGEGEGEEGGGGENKNH